MTSSTASTATPPRHTFERRLEEIKPSKTDINYVIMDYLVNEGYPAAARKFAVEANMPISEELESINERVEIRNAIHKGDIQTAIESINELNPQILDSNAALHFALLRLQLVELIRNCLTSPDSKSGIDTVIDFATKKLAPRAPQDPQFIDDLEKTLAVLLFPPGSLGPPLAEILDPKLRKKVSDMVNEAILIAQGAQREARIRHLVRLRMWSENKAREAKKIPQNTDLDLHLDDRKRDGSLDKEMTDVPPDRG